ncbi:hypothetical protein K502DRAFT_316610 [Neoconidiobolus thromboides FSU 785]|nr:hypothetical protein K502DRAFT_316610 [Neoconidiobolus thromboides FSU 785]
MLGTFNFHKITLFHWIWLFSTFVTVYAQDVTNPSTPSAGISVGQIIGGVIFIIVGLIFTFAGNRILKFIIFLAGGALLAYLTFLAANAIVDFNTATDGQKIGIYVAMGVLGLLGGFLAVCIWQLGLALLGGCLGASIGLLINRTNVIPGKTGQIILVVVLAIVFAILTFIFRNVLVIIATAVFGATTFMMGVDYFAKTGFNTLFQNIGQGPAPTPDAKIWAMIGSTIVIAIIGILVQFKTKKSS